MSARASPRRGGNSNGLPRAKEKEGEKGRRREERGGGRGGRGVEGRETDTGVKGENAFIYIYEIVDDAMRAYVRFEMHKEPARGRGINLQWEGGRGDKNGRDVRVNIRRTQPGMQNVYKIRSERACEGKGEGEKGREGVSDKTSLHINDGLSL